MRRLINNRGKALGVFLILVLLSTAFVGIGSIIYSKDKKEIKCDCITIKGETYKPADSNCICD